jgi:hypothetical protein
MMSAQTLPGRLTFFWDYDTQWGADRSRIAGGPKSWGPLEFPNTDRLLELHAQFGVRACFAAVGSAALSGERPYHDPAQIRRVHAAGHEIGSHSHRHDWLPALNPRDLRETVAASKDALEQCIGSAVTAFVPPWNQPFDYPPGFSFSLSERRTAGPERTGLSRLCATLREVGYRFCRVAYRPMHLRLAEMVLRRRIDRPVMPETIGDVTCLRLNSPGGFAGETVQVVNDCATRGGHVVVYGHPHSLTLEGLQHESLLVPLLGLVRDHVAAGRLEVVLPREM